MIKRSWTTKEITHLKRAWGLWSAKAIAEILGRTENAVRLKASQLKLHSALPHKGHDLSKFTELIEWGYHPTEIAKELNTSTKSVYNIIRDRLGGHWYARLKANAKRRGRRTPIRTKNELSRL